MSRKTFGGAIVLAFGLSGALAAQSTSQSPTQQPPATDQSMKHAQTVTVEGCLVREKDVPGRQPNVAERAGVMEDYLLTKAKFLKGSPHAAADTTATGTTGATGATGAATGTSGIAPVMFEVRGIEDAQLQQFVGQRVEIEGKIDPADFPERAREKAAGEPAGDLPELQGVVIRKASSNEPCNDK